MKFGLSDECIEDLKNLVGLSDTECPCFDDGKPADSGDSLTGYYITDSEFGFPSLKALLLKSNDCGEGSIWEMLENARSKAVDDFLFDLQIAIHKTQSSRFKKFNGYVGEQENASAANVSKQFIGLSIQSRNYKGSSFTLEEICLALTCQEDVEVFVYASNQTAPIASYTVESGLSEFGCFVLPEPLELPLYSDDCGGINYSIAYELPTGCKPLSNRLYCCNTTPGWKKYVKSGGVQMNAIDDQTKAENKNAYGLSLKGSMCCNGLSWLCDLDACGDYSAPHLIGRMIQAKAANSLIHQIIESGDINIYTTLKLENLFGKSRHLQKMYIDQLTWFAANLPTGTTDCYVCKKDNRIKSKGLFV